MTVKIRVEPKAGRQTVALTLASIDQALDEWEAIKALVESRRSTWPTP